jgi:hypothetical protein
MNDARDKIQAAYEQARLQQPTKRHAPASEALREAIIDVFYAGRSDHRREQEKP